MKGNTSEFIIDSKELNRLKKIKPDGTKVSEKQTNVYIMGLLALMFTMCATDSEKKASTMFAAYPSLRTIYPCIGNLALSLYTVNVRKDSSLPLVSVFLSVCNSNCTMMQAKFSYTKA